MAANERYISVNPVESIDWAKVDTKEAVEIYQAGQVSQLLNTADKQFPEYCHGWRCNPLVTAGAPEVQKLSPFLRRMDQIQLSLRYRLQLVKQTVAG